MTNGDQRQRAFGAVVQTRREALGWSRQRLADEMTWTLAAVRVIEAGQRTPFLTSAWRIADALRISLPLLLIDAEAVLADEAAAGTEAA